MDILVRNFMERISRYSRPKFQAQDLNPNVQQKRAQSRRDPGDVDAIKDEAKETQTEYDQNWQSRENDEQVQLALKMLTKLYWQKNVDKDILKTDLFSMHPQL